jgi:hypothetical protein
MRKSSLSSTIENQYPMNSENIGLRVLPQDTNSDSRIGCNLASEGKTKRGRPKETC